MHKFLSQTYGLSVVPMVLCDRIKPCYFIKVVSEALHPYVSCFCVHVFYTAIRAGDFIGRHGGVTDKDAFVIRAIAAQHLMGGDLRFPAAAVVAPDAFVEAVVEIEMFKMFELATRGAEQLFNDLHMRVH